MKKRVIISSKINSLPLDLRNNILSWLSVKHLYRFKRVSKQWRDLFSSKPFLQRHRQHHASHNSEGTILLIGQAKGSIFSYDFRANTVTDLTCYVPKVSCFAYAKYRAVGTCNGLVCIHDYRDELFFVYNPLTGACKKITASNIEPDRMTRYPPEPVGKTSRIQLVGFGYDRFSDDYKLLSIHRKWRITDSEPEAATLMDDSAQMYSFKAKEWKNFIGNVMCRGIHYGGERFLSKNRIMTLANNALHWLICSCSENKCHQKCAISSFDIHTKEYREIQAPAGMNTSYDDSQVNLSALDNCLHISHSTKELSRMEVWVMKEYGVQESWTKIFRCSLIDQPQDICGIRLCAYSEDGQEILAALQAGDTYKTSFVRCNLQQQKVSSVQFWSSDQEYLTILPWKGSRGSFIDD